MNPADLARLALAKRAYELTRPSDVEVQTGVRRARLALRRPRPRRSWWLKGLVFVVLTIGSLAYAKPHALAELVAQVLPQTAGGASQRAGGHGTAAPPIAEAMGLGSPAVVSAVSAGEPAASGQSTDARTADAKAGNTPKASADETGSNAAKTGSDKSASSGGPSALTAKKGPLPSLVPALGNRPPTQPSDSGAEPEAVAVSEWGRVGQALARGDEGAALAGLTALGESSDPRTRDKADLGRAQLLLAHGNRDDACSLARSLTRRRAGERVERQALVLLKSCSR